MDLHANFAYSTVATAPSPASSGTSLVVAAGNGALFPTVPFNAVIWPTAANALSTNAEIVRVTAISTDTFTITRAQESTSARTVVVGDQICAAITKKTITDIETPWLVKTANYTAVNGDCVMADTTGGAFTVTLPASPATLTSVTVKSGPYAATNNLTIGRNSQTILALAENMTISTPQMQVTFIFDGTTWQI